MNASALLDTHWDGSLPVNPQRIARSMGIKVTPAYGLDECSGQVQSINGVTAIRFDMTEAPVRQRFTVAHEIGHVALGHLGEGQTLFRDPPSNFSTSAGLQEAEANNFAAELLMPEKIVRYVISQKIAQNIVQLANLFFVSQVAMRYRLINLGLMSPAGIPIR